MEGHFSTGQSPQWAVVPIEEEEEEEEEVYFNSIDIRTSTFFTVDFIDNDNIRIKSPNQFLKYFMLNTSQFPPTLFKFTPHVVCSHWKFQNHAFDINVLIGAADR